MLDATFSFKLIDKIKVGFKNLVLGVNKEENKLIINNEDKSRHKYYHLHLHLPVEMISKLPENPSEILKDYTIRTLLNTIANDPEKIAKLLTQYSAQQISTAASAIAASCPNHALTTPVIPTPIFLKDLSKLLEANERPEIKFIEVGDTEGVSAEWGK